MLNRILRCILFCIAFISIERFCHHQTEGFRLHKIASSLEFNKEWEIAPLPQETQEEISRTLDQPFTFLGSGGQCYAFVSLDGKSVVKFFKHHHMRPFHWTDSVPLPASLNALRSKWQIKRRERLKQILGSCKIAYDDFKQESALIYIHLNNTNSFNKKLTFFDKLGIAHQIDLDRTTFALQKFAQLPYPTFHKLMKEGNTQEAQRYIDSLLDLIVTRCKRGIADKDPIIRRNFGFLEGRAVEIDLGSFTKDPHLSNAYRCKQELLIETVRFQHWIQKRHPQLTDYLNERIHVLTTDNS